MHPRQKRRAAHALRAQPRREAQPQSTAAPRQPAAACGGSQRDAQRVSKRWPGAGRRLGGMGGAQRSCDLQPLQRVSDPKGPSARTTAASRLRSRPCAAGGRPARGGALRQSKARATNCRLAAPRRPHAPRRGRGGRLRTAEAPYGDARSRKRSNFEAEPRGNARVRSRRSLQEGRTCRVEPP